MQFELDHRTCKMAHMNVRAEQHGEDATPACDLKFEAIGTLDDLVLFGPELRASWYDESNGAPRLRNPKLEGPFSWEGEVIGSTLTLHHGLGGKSDLVIQGCTVNGFRLTPQDGGSVLIACRVQCHPGEKEAGKLYGLVQGDVEVSIEPAQAELKI